MSTRTPEPPRMSPQVAAEQLTDRMGIQILELSRERVVGTMPVEGNRQPFGLLHGGASGVLVETLASAVAALHTLPDRFPVGLELACTHHRSATEGLVTGVATPLHVGRRTSTIEVVITDERGRRTCTGRLTCMHLEERPGPPPA
ncbi:MAG TPA: hotdog fold thioesterase [Pseudonocardia sp.]|uniref:PaaI family thioesterase n=1 Tax=Pseudonocardia sp. TaxID=60912 RepID=UPI002EDB6D88